MEWKYEVGTKIIIVTADPESKNQIDLIGTKQIVSKHVGYVTRTRIENSIPIKVFSDNSDWYIAPGYAIEECDVIFREDYVMPCEDTEITVTEDEFNNLFG